MSDDMKGFAKDAAEGYLKLKDEVVPALEKQKKDLLNRFNGLKSDRDEAWAKAAEQRTRIIALESKVTALRMAIEEHRDYMTRFAEGKPGLKHDQKLYSVLEQSPPIPATPDKEKS